MTSASNNAHPAVGASFIALLAGVWFAVSPWIYGAYGSADAWNCWAIGVLVFVLGVIRMNKPTLTALSWLNSILGIWIAVSPWVYGYTGHAGRFVNSLIVGFIVFCAAIAGANSQRESHNPTSTP